MQCYHKINAWVLATFARVLFYHQVVKTIVIYLVFFINGLPIYRNSSSDKAMETHPPIIHIAADLDCLRVTAEAMYTKVYARHIYQ